MEGAEEEPDCCAGPRYAGEAVAGRRRTLDLYTDESKKSRRR